MRSKSNGITVLGQDKTREGAAGHFSCISLIHNLTVAVSICSLTSRPALQILFGVLMTIFFMQIPTAEALSVAPFSLVQKTRRSGIVVIGVVSEVRSSSLLVNISKVIHGSPSGNSIEIDLKGLPIVNYKAGDEVVVFGNKRGSRYLPFIGDQGSMKPEGDSPAKYESAIKSILEYDVARSTEQKHALLLGMLRGNNRLLQHAALWEFVYEDRILNKRGPDIDGLLPTLGELAKGTDDRNCRLATEIIGHAETKKSVPILIDIVGKGNPAAADAASRVLRGKVPKSEQDSLRHAPNERQKAVRDWEDWWARNKDKYK